MTEKREYTPIEKIKASINQYKFIEMCLNPSNSARSSLLANEYLFDMYVDECGTDIDASTYFDNLSQNIKQLINNVDSGRKPTSELRDISMFLNNSPKFIEFWLGIF